MIELRSIARNGETVKARGSLGCKIFPVGMTDAEIKVAYCGKEQSTPVAPIATPIDIPKPEPLKKPVVKPVLKKKPAEVGVKKNPKTVKKVKGA